MLGRNAVLILNGQRFHANGGVALPAKLNSYEKLRELVKFEEISVTMSGTDHATGNTVYGNRFATTLVQNYPTDEVGVELSLLNGALELTQQISNRPLQWWLLLQTFESKNFEDEFL